MGLGEHTTAGAGAQHALQAATSRNRPRPTRRHHDHGAAARHVWQQLLRQGDGPSHVGGYARLQVPPAPALGKDAGVVDLQGGGAAQRGHEAAQGAASASTAQLEGCTAPLGQSTLARLTSTSICPGSSLATWATKPLMLPGQAMSSCMKRMLPPAAASLRAASCPAGGEAAGARVPRLQGIVPAAEGPASGEWRAASSERRAASSPCLASLAAKITGRPLACEAGDQLGARCCSSGLLGAPASRVPNETTAHQQLAAQR